MRTHRDDLTAEYVREILDYNPETGVFVWKKLPKFRSDRTGKQAGCPDDRGYIRIRINNRYYRAHRLAWLIMTNQWPGAYDIDHRNRNKSDNRWENLRLATRGENNANTLHKSGRNKHGYRGVGFNSHGKKIRRYQAYVAGESLGMFLTAEEAYAAYCKRAKELYGEFFNPERRIRRPRSGIVRSPYFNG